MEPGSIEKLKFDKRLRLRQGWSGEEETQRYLDALPDVSDKIALESDEAADPETSEETATSEQDRVEPAAISTDPSRESPGGASAGESGKASAEASSEPQADAADGLAEEPRDPLSPPPFKEI